MKLNRKNIVGLIMAGLLFTRLGEVFIPTLDEKNIAMNALRIPSTSLSQSQAMQLMVERTIGQFPQVAVVFSKTNTYEFSQPIQWRFNELIAGVRGDIAVKVFGEEFDPMLRAANQIASILRATKGAEDVKVEQVTGLPFLEIKIDKTETSRLGLSVSAVQDVIGAAIGGREAGVVFEGDRRFPIIVRLNDQVRENMEALKNLPVPLPPGTQTGRAPAILLKQVARF